MVGNHDVLVATACADQKASCVISVEFLDRLHADVEIVGLNLWGGGEGRQEKI